MTPPQARDSKIVSFPENPQEHVRRQMAEAQRLANLAPGEWQLWIDDSAERLGIPRATLERAVEAILADRERKARQAKTEDRRRERRASFEAAVDCLIWEIEGTLKILHATGTPAITTSPCAFWRPAPTYSGKRNKAKAGAAKKAVGKGNAVPGPYPPETKPCVFEPLPQKRTQSGVVDVADSAVALLARLILMFTSWPHGVEDPPLAPYREPAAPKPTKGKRLRKGRGRKQPLAMICAAVEQQIRAEAKKAGFEVLTWLTPEIHDAIERVHHALMRHNIPASQSAYLMAFTKTQHRHNAEDLSQRTKETILQGLASLAPWQTPDALMSATCKNLFLNDVEKYRREVDDAKGYFTGNFAVPADQDRHEESLEDWVNDTDLPPHLKTILILRAADTSCAEIAHRFDCPVGTIYSHIHRAHGQLQKWVQEHPRSPSSDDDEPHLPLGVRVGQWTEPTDCGRRGFNPAGFDGLRSEQLDGKIPRGFDPERWRPQETSFYYGLRTSDGRYVPKTSDPGRRIPVTPALNAYYKARLQFAHWHNLARRKQSECYFECGCAAEQPCPEWLVEFVKYQVALEPVSKNRDAWWWSKSRMRATTRLAGPRYRCSACGCPIVPLKNSEQPRQPWRLVCCHRERPITGVSREWFCWEKEIRPIDCVKCGAPAPFLLTPAISFENTRVQLHPKPSWRHHVRSAHVEEYTPKMRSNLGVPTGGEAPLMDTIEADRELPVVFREWKLAAEGGELGT